MTSANWDRSTCDTTSVTELSRGGVSSRRERDALGNRDEVEGYTLSEKIEVRWLPDGDHSFKPRKASGRTTEENWQDGIEAVASFSRRFAGRSPLKTST